MERPPKKYVCEKCGYFGDTSEHEGCNYLAWTTCEQLYIDQLEAELTSLRASPASVPEGWKLVPVEPTMEMCEAGHRLALELECLLLDCKDNVVVSRWIDTACEALDAWQKLFPYNGPRLGD